MAKMKIKGGDLDPVEYEFQPFHLGECIRMNRFAEEKNVLSPCHLNIKFNWSVKPQKIKI